MMPDGQERPIAFVSRTLSKSEQNYAQLEREALGIIFAPDSVCDSLGVSNPLKKNGQTAPHQNMLFGRVSRKIVLAHPKTNSSIFSGQMKQKK